MEDKKTNEDATQVIECTGGSYTIHLDEKESCKVNVKYFADPEKVLAKRKEVTNELFEETSKIAVPGYRKGRAPLEVVKVRYKKQIEEALVKEMVSQAHNDVLFETKMKTLFYPQLINSALHDSQFHCEMLFIKRPVFELKEYKGLSIPKPHLPKTHAELAEQMMQDLRIKYGDVAPYGENDFVQMNDKITMDVKCTAENKIVPDLTKEGVFYTVGQGFYPEFDDSILGMSPGEERSFDVLWDTQTKERATFVVRLHMGVKSMPAPLDDSFAQKLGIESFEKLRTEVTGVAGKKIQEFELKTIQEQINIRLMSIHEFEIPEWLVNLDAQQLAIQHGLDWAKVDEQSRKMLLDKAKDRVKLTLIMDAIREAEPETQFNNTELMNVIRKRVAEQGQDPNKFLVEAQRSGQLFGIVAALQQEATLGWLVKQVNLVE